MSDEPPPKDYSGSSPFRRRRRRPLLERSIPISRDLPGYRPRSARTDLVAGLTVAALAIPAGMAYAEVAGLSPVIGLYALLLPTVAYAPRVLAAADRRPGGIDLGPGRGRW